ncbi:MAG TPA: NYN domain-containing protein [Azonexus sp.]|nr:NYN domain-containing protein [Azonexus sp.]
MENNGIALLIDADNCPASRITDILDELSKYGVINIRRAYGDWKNPALNGWAEILHEYAIQPMQQFAYTKRKNATDSALIIDAMDLLYTQRLSAFGIASSDSDFTPLAMRLRANGLKVFGFGEEKTPQPFVNACTKFLFLENFGLPAPAPSSVAQANLTAPAKKTTNELRSDTRLVTNLRNAVAAVSDEEGWAALGGVGSHMNKNWSAFDPRNFGYAKLSDLVIASELFELRRDNHNHMQLRSTRKNSKKPSPLEQANP